MYTEQSLNAALVALNPVNEKMMDQRGYFKPRMCWDTAAHCWVHSIPENEHSRILREAIDDLKKEGHFRFGLV